MFENLSARLMVAAKDSEAGILVDKVTRDAAANSSSIKFIEKDPIKVKGKSQLIPIFVPVKRHRLETRKQAFSRALVGRSSEMDMLQSKLKKIFGQKAANHVHVQIIEGEAGVGVDTFKQSLTVTRKITSSTRV